MKSVFQMKDHGKIPEKEPLWNGGNLPKKEIKVMVLKMFTELATWMNTARTSVKRKYKKAPNRLHRAEEYSNWIKKNTLEGSNNRLDEAEEKSVMWKPG